MSENFSDSYKEEVFALWYETGKKISNKFSNSLPEENGNRPSPKTVEKWRDQFGWLQRADILDAELSQVLQTRIIDKRIKMYEEHSKIADELIQKGRTFLRTVELRDASDAIRAISLGVEIEKESIGQAEVGRRLLTMSDEQLNKELERLIGKPKALSDSIIDAEVDED